MTAEKLDKQHGDMARRECRICWYVYEPADGDSVWQVPPGTAFSALPEQWRCPNCDAAKAQFILCEAGDGHA